MNRAELALSRNECLVAVRSKTGTRLHLAYRNGGPTFCGVRFPRILVLNVSQVDDERCCEKCYPCRTPAEMQAEVIQKQAREAAKRGMTLAQYQEYNR